MFRWPIWLGRLCVTSADFPQKLELVLKALSLSRGRLAADLAVSKSLVSRWVSGGNAPASHNLEALTALIARRREGFNMLDWDRELPDLAALFGVSVSAPTAADPAAHGTLYASRLQSAVEVQREGGAYPGVYVGFRQTFRNTGEIIGDVIILWRQDGRLFYRHFDPVFSHLGEALILRHQLFLFGEDDGRVDGLAFYILNGVVGQKAMRIDGLAMTVQGDRFRTPGATPVVLQRLMDLGEDGLPPPDDLLADIVERLSLAYQQSTLCEMAGPDIVAVVTPRVGVPLEKGGVDHILRAPGERSLSASEVDWNPALEADARRLRNLLLDAPKDFAILDPGWRTA